MDLDYWPDGGRDRSVLRSQIRYHKASSKTRRVIRFGRVYPKALNPGVDELLSVLESLAQESEDMEGSA